MGDHLDNTAMCGQVKVEVATRQRGQQRLQGSESYLSANLGWGYRNVYYSMLKLVISALEM